MAKDNQPRLILGSGSPRRRELLRAVGLDFEVAKPDIDETPLPHEPAPDYVARLSREKALAASSKSTQADGQPTVLITADTTVALEGEIIGKPADTAEAEAILTKLRDRVHMVHTGLTLHDSTNGTSQTVIINTEVTMRAYTDEEMRAYIESGEPFDKAGAYGIQAATFRPVAALDGCLTNVMGLPMCAVRDLLAARQITIQTPCPCAPNELACPCQWDIGVSVAHLPRRA